MMAKLRLIRWRGVWRFLFLFALTLVLLAGAVNAAVLRGSRGAIRSRFAENEEYDCILVLGAGLRSDGSPSDMLRDRLRGAVELYRMGVSDTILLSGDRSGEDYDEVSAMAAYCLAEGIPEEALRRDFVGYSTYESVYNAVRESGYGAIVIVTQEYHLYRALYIAKEMGAEAIGFAADYHTYRGQLFRDVREVVARGKDFWKATFS